MISEIAENEENCPCRSGMQYELCCKPYLENESIPSNPETLMRSRYTAFTKENWDYLKNTWHPETVPESLEGENSTWIGLEILDSQIDEEQNEAEVEFIAKLIYDDKLEILHEISHFDLIDGRWLYHSGEFQNEDQPIKKISKSAPCPCGSQKKYKNCKHSF